METPTPIRTYVAQVEAMAGYGIPEEDIASVLGIELATLKREYPSELANGHVKANAKVAESLYRKAVGEGRESVTAAIFWLKTRAGWRETSNHEVTSPREIVVRWLRPDELA
jgi:hypothetical protein